MAEEEESVPDFPGDPSSVPDFTVEIIFFSLVEPLIDEENRPTDSDNLSSIEDTVT